MIYSKNQLKLSTTIGQGLYASDLILLLMSQYCSGESGLVYKAYINTAIGKELVAVKTGKGIILQLFM